MMSNDLKNSMFAPLYCRQLLYPKYFGKENELFLERQKDFENFFLSLGNRIGTEELETLFVIHLYSCLLHSIRSIKADCIIKSFIKRYSEASKTIIVNLGAGLDTTFYRFNSIKSLNWYNLDIPEATKFRKDCFGEEDEINTIEKSVFDKSWFNDIDYKKGDNILFIALGLFSYFKSNDVISLIRKMSEKFPNGELFFNVSYEKSGIVDNGNLDKTLRFNFGHLYGLLKEASNLELSCSESFSREAHSIKNMKMVRNLVSREVSSSENMTGIRNLVNGEVERILANLKIMIHSNPIQLVHLKFKYLTLCQRFKLMIK